MQSRARLPLYCSLAQVLRAVSRVYDFRRTCCAWCTLEEFCAFDSMSSQYFFVQQLFGSKAARAQQPTALPSSFPRLASLLVCREEEERGRGGGRLDPGGGWTWSGELVRELPDFFRHVAFFVAFCNYCQIFILFFCGRRRTAV